MTYNGNHLFHYTSFEAAQKILSNRNLLFSLFRNLNDIAEASREVFSEVCSETIQIDLSRYQILSFTQDTASLRGFAINSMWGYYASRGRGVCLVFDKRKLLDAFRRQFTFGRRRRIKYLKTVRHACFIRAIKARDAISEVNKNFQELFFTKSADWRHENEYRLLTKSSSEGISERLHIEYDDALLAVVLHLSCDKKLEKSTKYRILKSLCHVPILRYTTQLGEKVLDNVDGKRLWPINECEKINDSWQL